MEPFEQDLLKPEGHYLLVTGIANTDLLCEHLSNTGLIYKHLAYPDHVDYSQEVLTEIQIAFANLHSPIKAILTTEKDFVKLASNPMFLYRTGCHWPIYPSKLISKSAIANNCKCI